MAKRELDPSQLDLFKTENNSALKKDEKITRSEWEKADELAFEMMGESGKMIKNSTREEREAENEEVRKGFRVLRAKLGLPPKEGDQAEMPLENDKK